jgi:hypothetical protein
MAGMGRPLKSAFFNRRPGSVAGSFAGGKKQHNVRYNLSSQGGTAGGRSGTVIKTISSPKM